MEHTHRAARSVGPQLTRRTLLRGGVAIGLAAAGGHAWPFATRARASAVPGPGRDDWGELDRGIQTAAERFGVVGAAVAVLNAAGPVHQRTFGSRDLATAAPVTPHTLFRVASTTKSMSALLVARCVDDGLLDWDQPVREVWPAFRAPTEQLTATLRVRDLLGMATGLGVLPVTDLQRAYRTPLQVLESVAYLPVLGPPHTRFFYNNTVYTLGGYLPVLALDTVPAELLTTYSRLMQERVYGPVGMLSARIADDPRPFSDDSATGYALDSEQGLAVEPWATVGSFAPVGGTLASLTDMAAYVTLLLRGGITRTGRRVVSAQNLGECWKPAIEDPLPPALAPDVTDQSYCLGWSVARYAGHRVVSHAGAVDGFACIIACLPDDDLGLAVLSNLGPVPGGALFCSYALNLLLEQRLGLSARVNALVEAGYQDAVGALAEQAARAVPIEPAAIAPFLGYYEGGFRLAFDATGALRLHLHRRAWRVLGQPDGSYVTASGLMPGTAIRFSRDTVGVPRMEVEDLATVRWLSGLG